VDDDPLRMYLVLRRGAIASLSRAGELAGAAAVACVRGFADDETWGAALREWGPRPGKVCLRARTDAQWRQVLEEPHALAEGTERGARLAAHVGGCGTPPGAESVAALPPRRRSQRGPLLERLQAMSSELEPPPARAGPRPGAVTYVLNPRAPMSSGKTVAQVAHAAVLASDRGDLEEWVAAGCPGQVIAPGADGFDAAQHSGACVARVVDAGLTELPPGTLTVVALAP
jgi:peptidyl-tRNA hydrolase PTH2